MRRARPLRLSGRIVRYAARKTGRSGRSRRRFADLLRRPERFPVRDSGQALLLGRGVAPLQAGSSRSRLPARRCERDVRQVEQVFHYQQHARRIVAILEQRTRPAARRSDAGCRRYADHAHAGRQHGVAAEKYPNGQDPSSGTGGARPDEFHPVNGQQKPRPHVGAFLVVSASVYGLKIK